MSAQTRKHRGNKDPKLKEATISEKQEDILENLQEDIQTGEHEVNRRIFYHVMKNEEPDIVEGSTPL